MELIIDRILGVYGVCVLVYVGLLYFRKISYNPVVWKVSLSIWLYGSWVIGTLLLIGYKLHNHLTGYVRIGNYSITF